MNDKLFTPLIFFLILFLPQNIYADDDGKTKKTFHKKNQKILPLKILPHSCLCAQVWIPVCGANKKTYSNACFAKCAGVQFEFGSCLKKD